MATNTRTQRQAAAKKAAATRKQNAAKRSASATKSSARRTASSARATSRSAKSTARQGGRASGQTARAATTRLEALGRQAERALLIQIGAATALRDAVVHTAQTYTNPKRIAREFDNFERRGERAVGRRRRSLIRRRREVDEVRREAGRQMNGLRDDAAEVVERVKQLA